MGKIDFRDLAVKAAKIADDKKALGTVILDVRDLTAIADYFVITTAESTPQINAVCSEIEKDFKERGIQAVRREGISSQSWRVIDYGGLVVHVMSPSVRDMYKLERLWQDAKSVKFQETPVLKIVEPEKLKEFAEKAKKTIKREGKKIKKKMPKTVKRVKKAVKKARTKIKGAEKKAKKAGAKLTKAAKTIKAVGKGIEAFGKTLVKKKK